MKETTVDKLYLQFGSVLRETSSLLRETGKEGQVWEPRAPEHASKLMLKLSPHVVWLGLLVWFGLGFYVNRN